MAPQAEALAARLRHRAQSLERYAANYRANIDSEAALDGVVGRLVHLGWHPLSDRRSPKGGGVDDLLVGPAGVAVLEAKRWTHPLKVKGDRLYSGPLTRTRELDRVVRLVESARDVLRRASLETVAVRGFMVLCSDVDRSRTPEEVRGVWICGMDLLEHGFHQFLSVHPPHVVEQISTLVEQEFPPKRLAA
ncbi:MAG: hypothetical protein ACRDV8_14075 [Acidimicrobiales bacterium]